MPGFKNKFAFIITCFLPVAAFPQHSGMKHMSMPGPGRPSAAAIRINDPEARPPGSESRSPGSENIVRYDLYISDTVVNYSGKRKAAMAINGSIPAPALYFTEGDTAEIYVHNNMNMETSIHWHGLILPNQYDGVSYLTTSPIRPGETHLYKFPLVQNGTYWYHSHTMFQQQSGIYGAFVIRKKDPGPAVSAGPGKEAAPVTAAPAIAAPVRELTLLLSDWSDDPAQVDRALHNATDWYAIRKGSTQNYAAAIRQGYLKTKLGNEWRRMLPMDVSDVAYDRFLINGRSDNPVSRFKPGDRVRLRIVNGSSSTYFWLSYGGGKMSIVANDGKDLVPVEADRMMIAVAETYDVIVTIPKHGLYEFLATPEDRSGSVNFWLGDGGQADGEQTDGEKKKAPPLPKLNYFAGMRMMNGMMDMHGNLKGMDMSMSFQQMDMNAVMYPEITGDDKSKIAPDSNKTKMDDMPGMKMETPATDLVTLNYGMLRSPVKTTLPEGPERILRFNLTGNMNRYVWSINNKTVSEADTILIKKGENVKIILYNGTMMRHPMHLHGHFFRVLNGQGDYSPLKNTLDIMPMETDTLEFAATASGDWFFHCHILYHMMSGMGRIFRYEDSPPNPEVPDPKMALKMIYMDDRRIHPSAKIGLESNGSDGQIVLSDTRWKASTLWHLGYTGIHGYESETMIGRYLGRMQWWFPYAGFDYHYKKAGGPKNIFGSEEKTLFGQTSDKDNRKTAVAGITYTLPMLFAADVRIDGKGKFRFQLGREDIAITSRLRFGIMVNTDKEYTAGFRYIATKYLGLSTHYDSDMGFGLGITLNY